MIEGFWIEILVAAVIGARLAAVAPGNEMHAAVARPVAAVFGPTVTLERRRLATGAEAPAQFAGRNRLNPVSHETDWVSRRICLADIP